MDFSYTEIVGYIASAVVLVSFLMKNMTKLRIINMAGCGLFVYYGVLLGMSLPIIVTNSAILCIHGYYLIKSIK